MSLEFSHATHKEHGLFGIDVKTGQSLRSIVFLKRLRLNEPGQKLDFSFILAFD